MINCTAVGVDIAKNVFQVHYVDQETGEIVEQDHRAVKRIIKPTGLGGFKLEVQHQQ